RRGGWPRSARLVRALARCGPGRAGCAGGQARGRPCGPAAPTTDGASDQGGGPRRNAWLRGAGGAPPVRGGVAAESAGPGRAQAVALADILGAFAGHEVVDQTLITLGTGSPPGREVGAKSHLLGHGGLGVVVQGLVEDVAFRAARGGERTDRETAAPLGHRR